MIRTIEITNFQSHADTTLELSEGVNVIKGRSHSGKSSIIRALRWALLNEPRGTNFVSHFTPKKGETLVGIEFDDESYIIRKRDNKVNGYELPDTTLAAIRSDIPEEVTTITHMNDINIQTQAEQHFMLRETPGKVAKELNSLVGLDIIDQTLTRLNKIENENKVKLTLLEKDSIEVKENLEELDFLDDLEKRVIEIEEMWSEYQYILKEKKEVTELSEEISTLESDIKENSEWLSIKAPVDELLGLIEKQRSVHESLNRLNNACATIKSSEVVRSRADGRVSIARIRIEEIENSAAFKKQHCSKCGSHIAHWRKT